MDLPHADIFTRAQAIASGLTDDELRRARGAGEIVTLRPGFYVASAIFDLASPTARHHLLARSYLMGAPDGEVLSHVSAAIAWGFDIWNIPLNKVHMTHGLDFASKRRPLRTLHGTTLADDDRDIVGGLAVTSAARTVIDVARSNPVEQAVCLGDSALRRGHTTGAQLAEELASARFRTGAPAARRAVGLMSGRSESVGESRSRLMLETLALPTPLLNQWVHDELGVFVGRVDFLFPGCWVIGEFDGEGKYESKQTVLDEKYREDRLRDLGWLVVRWSWRDLGEKEALRRRLEQAFTRGSRLPAPSGWFGDERLGNDKLPSFG